MTTKDLRAKEFDPYYGRYIYKLSEAIDLRTGFEKGKTDVIHFFQSISEDRLLYKYAEDKWTIKDILQHLIDTERIFIYRCFRIARNDKTELAGFDQNIYIAPSGASNKSIKDLINEFSATRSASITLLYSLTDDDLKNTGIANGSIMSARAAAFTIIGHDIWHMDVVKEKYL